MSVPSHADVIVLNRRPGSSLVPGDLMPERRPLRAPGPGEVVVRNVVTSVDPYQLRMLRGSSEVTPVAVGEPVPAKQCRPRLSRHDLTSEGFGGRSGSPAVATARNSYPPPRLPVSSLRLLCREATGRLQWGECTSGFQAVTLIEVYTYRTQSMPLCKDCRGTAAEERV